MPGGENNGHSIFQPVINVLDHFVLKTDQALFMPPPVIDIILQWFMSLDQGMRPGESKLNHRGSIAAAVLRTILSAR